jgi:hypothetical protein
MDVKKIKMEKHEQRLVMKFFLLQGKRYKAIQRELTGVLEEASVSVAMVRC